MLADELGIPVIGTVARSQKGLIKLKDAIDDIVTGKLKNKPLKISYNDEIEEKIKEMLPQLEEILQGKLNPRWVALRVIEGDETLLNSMEDYLLNKKSINNTEEIPILGETAL